MAEELSGSSIASRMTFGKVIVRSTLNPLKVMEIAEKVKLSVRSEIEISSVNEVYLKMEQFYVTITGRGMT